MMRAKINGVTSLALSVGLAGQPFVIKLIDATCNQEICRQDTLVEPPHTHQEPQIPGQGFVVKAHAVSGANAVSQSHNIDAYIAGADLVLPLGGLRATANRSGAHPEYFAHLRHGVPGVQQGANLCAVYSGTGATYMLAVQPSIALSSLGSLDDETSLKLRDRA